MRVKMNVCDLAAMIICDKYVVIFFYSRGTD